MHWKDTLLSVINFSSLLLGGESRFVYRDLNMKMKIELMIAEREDSLGIDAREY